MAVILGELLSFVVQLLVLLVVPVVWHRVSEGSFRGLWDWLGLRPPDRGGVLLALAVLVACLPLLLVVQARVPSLRELMSSPSTPTGRLRQLGPSAVGLTVLVVVAVLKTGLCEELFFRGFVAKRCIARFGFPAGNALQAVLFAAIHLPLLALVPPAARTAGLATFVVANALCLSLVAAWLNERRGGGSIVPGWIVHAAVNAAAYSFVAFGR